jgi:hypothetical protein
MFGLKIFKGEEDGCLTFIGENLWMINISFGVYLGFKFK